MYQSIPRTCRDPKQESHIDAESHPHSTSRRPRANVAGHLIAIVCGLMVGAGMAAAESGSRKPWPVQSGDLSRQHAEMQAPHGPWLPGPGQPPPGYVPLLAPPTVGSYVSIQVNVDACGNNIPGDAANETSIAVDPTAPNRIVMGWRQFDNIATDFRQNGWAYSWDGGRSWTFPGAIQPTEFRSDPVLAANSSGVFYYMTLGSQSLSPPAGFFCELFRSDDGGASWVGPVSAFGGDKEWMAIDRSGGPGDGHIYTSWGFGDLFPSAHFTRSINGGASFQSPLVPLPSAPVHGTMDVAADGKLYLSGWAVSAFHVLRSDDAENPAVFPTTFAVDAVVDLGGARVFGGVNTDGILGQPSVNVDPSSGNVYLLCSVDPPGADPLDVHFSRSLDGGMTWSAPVRVNDDPAGNGAWQWFGTMSVAPNGRIDVVWNDTRNDPDNPAPNTSELFYAFSTDAGVSWSTNVPVSPAFDHFVGYPMRGPAFVGAHKLGDYYGMISDDVGAHVAYAATHNGEQDVYYLRIGGYDCNGNGIPDSADIASATSTDCNTNGIPDECEIAAGAAGDSNANMIPDECETIAAKLDIKPGSCPNPLNLKSQGVLTVALVGTAGFDVSEVDLSSLTIGRSDDRGGDLAPLSGPGGLRPRVDDVATAFAGDPCDCHAAGADGTDDLVLKFRTEEVVEALSLGCELPGAVVELEVTGALLDGTPFVAQDCVKIVPMVEVSPSQVAFQSVQSGATACERVTIRNKGISSVDGLSVFGCEGGDYTLDVSNLAAQLAPGESTAFDVCVTASSVGPGACSIRIATDDEAYDLTVSSESATTDVARAGGLPKRFAVYAPQPNPFNPHVTIRYDIPNQSAVWTTIYDVLGRRVRSLLDGAKVEAGEHELGWDSRDDHGIPVASGVYIFRVRMRADTAEDRTQERVVRAVLMR